MVIKNSLKLTSESFTITFSLNALGQRLTDYLNTVQKGLIKLVFKIEDDYINSTYDLKIPMNMKRSNCKCESIFLIIS